jgi:Protein of unknown function (DUF2752)
MMNERSRLLLTTVLGGAAALFVFVVDPARAALYPPCLFHILTGLYCPGCGSARAVHQLLHGHVAAAFGLNPAATLFVPVLGCAYLASAARAFSRRPRRAVILSQGWFWLVLVSVVVYWFARNIPVYPFHPLAQ